MKKGPYYDKLGKVIFSKKTLHNKIRKIAKQIDTDYAGKEVVLLCNLVGSFRFLADLVSYLEIPAIIDFIAFTSYRGAKSTGQVRIIKDLKIDVTGRHVIIVEDIIDSGRTVHYIIKHLKDFKSPASIKVCALLDKACCRTAKVPIDYKGFLVDDLFIVGYGLDYNDHYRELNDIYIFKDTDGK